MRECIRGMAVHSCVQCIRGMRENFKRRIAEMCKEYEGDEKRKCVRRAWNAYAERMRAAIIHAFKATIFLQIV